MRRGDAMEDRVYTVDLVVAIDRDSARATVTVQASSLEKAAGQAKKFLEDYAGEFRVIRVEEL
jgi:hypothetical protein